MICAIEAAVSIYIDAVAFGSKLATCTVPDSSQDPSWIEPARRQIPRPWTPRYSVQVMLESILPNSSLFWKLSGTSGKYFDIVFISSVACETCMHSPRNLCLNRQAAYRWF